MPFLPIGWAGLGLNTKYNDEQWQPVASGQWPISSSNIYVYIVIHWPLATAHWPLATAHLGVSYNEL